MLPISALRTLSLPTAPNGAVHLVRADTIVSMAPPFAWSASIQARIVRCANGETILMLDTPQNVALVTAALLSAPEAGAVAVTGGSAVIATTLPPDAALP